MAAGRRRQPAAAPGPQRIHHRLAGRFARRFTGWACSTICASLRPGARGGGRRLPAAAQCGTADACRKSAKAGAGRQAQVPAWAPEPRFAERGKSRRQRHGERLGFGVVEASRADRRAPGCVPRSAAHRDRGTANPHRRMRPNASRRRRRPAGAATAQGIGQLVTVASARPVSQPAAPQQQAKAGSDRSKERSESAWRGQIRPGTTRVSMSGRNQGSGIRNQYKCAGPHSIVRPDLIPES
jgi:hypothetical protein